MNTLSGLANPKHQVVISALCYNLNTLFIKKRIVYRATVETKITVNGIGHVPDILIWDINGSEKKAIMIIEVANNRCVEKDRKKSSDIINGMETIKESYVFNYVQKTWYSWKMKKSKTENYFSDLFHIDLNDYIHF